MRLTIAWESLKSRRQSVLLTFFSLVISISVLMSVEHLRTQVKESFNRTVSGVDLIVGAPTGQLNLLLYSVFRMGSPTNTIRYASYQKLARHKQVDWVIPIALGDSHRGFRVLGTTSAYFSHFKYANKQSLTFQQGQQFNGLFEAVIGADVARQLNYKLGDKIVIAHGIGDVSFTKHERSPFVISGILAATGTPVDKSVHVSLSAIEAIHLPPTKLHALLQEEELNAVNQRLMPKNLSALMLGLNSRIATFKLQRQINQYPDDRLMAILPGVALAELWQIMGSVENLLLVTSSLILLASLFGLTVMLLASMRERQREFAVMRAVGASPGVIFSLIVLEATLLTALAILASIALVSGLIIAGKDYLVTQFGLFLDGSIVTENTAILSLLIIVAAGLTALLPAINAYRSALHVSLHKVT